MSYAFVEITPALERALEQGLLLTSNDRLRRDLIRSFDLHQQGRGLRAWPSARVYSLQGWWNHLYQAALVDDPLLPVLLSQEQAYLLMRELAPAGQQHLSHQALQAWEQLHQWHISRNDDSLSVTDDGRMFAAWAARFARTLDSARQITSAQLPQQSVLLEHVGTRPVFCLAFENPTAAARDWLARLHQLGTPVEMLQSNQTKAAETRRSGFDTPEAEIAAAAYWCRALLEQHHPGSTTSAEGEQLRIGVVVPDLSNRYQSVLRQFLAEFAPLADDLGRVPFDLGGGGRLIDQPIWRAAESWLELCYRRLPLKVAQRLSGSRYLQLPDLPDWPELAPEQIDIHELARIFRSPALAQLIPAVGSPRRSFSAWLADFQHSLIGVHWSGDAAGTLQYQAYQQLQALLGELSTVERERTMDAAAALDELRGALSLRLFAPQRNPAPIQVLGYLETTGLSFTHLWVASMDEETWPGSVSGNPLLPMAARKKYLLPRSTPAQELSFARERLDHWVHCTTQLIASYPTLRGDNVCEPSPLVVDFPETHSAIATGRPHPFFQTRAQLEWVNDTAASPYPSGLRSGGSGLFADQAGCPFRAWAVHRLELREPRDPHAFPDPLDRGTVFHKAMQNLYQDYLKETTTPGPSDSETIDAAVSAALHQHYRRFPSAFVEREHLRLVSVIQAWLELEARRGPFTVKAIETAQEIEIDGVRIRIRVDRLDQVGDALLIVDYKTGRIVLPSSDGDLLEPQLPIYAMADDRIRGVFYAQLDESRPRLAGIGVDDLDMGTARVTAPLAGDWAAQKDQWSRQLSDLAAEMTTGYAAVSPRRPQICNHCHLAGLCRIDELRESE